MLLYLISEALTPNSFYFAGRSSSSVFTVEFSCNSRHLKMLTFWNMPFVCILMVYSFSFNLYVVADLSCVACCPLHKALFAHLNIQVLANNLWFTKNLFLFRTSVCIAGRVESVMYLCAVFSWKACPVSRTGKLFHSHNFIHKEVPGL